MLVASWQSASCFASCRICAMFFRINVVIRWDEFYMSVFVVIAKPRGGSTLAIHLALLAGFSAKRFAARHRPKQAVGSERILSRRGLFSNLRNSGLCKLQNALHVSIVRVKEVRRSRRLPHSETQKRLPRCSGVFEMPYLESVGFPCATKVGSAASIFHVQLISKDSADRNGKAQVICATICSRSPERSPNHGFQRRRERT
jgi:hypothetical protein